MGSHATFEGLSSAYIFKTPESISMIFGTYQHRFILNNAVDSIFIKFIIQSGATWQKLITWILLTMNANGSSA